ncbi:MAG: hypothetical protein HC925_01075 [Coleofasciculaceae cyanobacterium SM2_3_26]|nr:hypothetical protein [Coleofasciculaceae cyanobacterium SM2_3_26]
MIGSAIPATAPHLPAKAGDALEEPAIAISEEDTFTEPFLNREFLDPDTKRYQVLNIFPITELRKFVCGYWTAFPYKEHHSRAVRVRTGDVIIPPSAEPYLALSQKMYPALPELHNVWIDDRRTVLLLESDRTWQCCPASWAKKK